MKTINSKKAPGYDCIDNRAIENLHVRLITHQTQNKRHTEVQLLPNSIETHRQSDNKKSGKSKNNYIQLKNLLSKYQFGIKNTIPQLNR